MNAKRKDITLKDKYTLVSRIRDGEKQAEVARRFGLTKSTVSGIWKKRELILKAYEGRSHHSRRMRNTANDMIDRQLFIWYRARVNANLPVRGFLMKKQAEDIAQTLGDKFQCTKKWLDRFKIRHGILFKQEEMNSDQEHFKHNFWPQVRVGYPGENIFTVREVGIFFNCFPNEELDLCCNKGEFANSRLTLCLCANMTGTEKRPLFIVGNKPCIVNLPVRYKYNTKCWMNLALSSEQLTIWNEELVLSKRHVILLVKFSPAFRTLSDLSHVKIGYYQDDISAHPLDPAMAELKFYYRKYLLQNKNEVLSRLQCIRYLYKSWMRVRIETLTDGFQILDGTYNKNRLSLKSWAKSKGLDVPENIDDCLSFDDDLVTSVHFLSDAAEIGEPLECMESQELDETEEEEVINCEEALKIAHSLARFIEYKGSSSLQECLVKVEHFIEDTLEEHSSLVNEFKK